MTARNRHPRTVISVGGIDGSGKSSFARRLCEEYSNQGLGALLLSVDDFRRRVDWERRDITAADLYGEHYYDFAALEVCLIAFRSGMPSVRRPCFDIAREEVVGSTELSLADTDVVVVEGVFMMRLRSFQEHFRIWLSASFELCKQRMIKRGQPPWRPREEVERRIEQRYFPAQERYIASFAPLENAHVVIDNSDFTRPEVPKAELEALPKVYRSGLESYLERLRGGL